MSGLTLNSTKNKAFWNVHFFDGHVCKGLISGVLPKARLKYVVKGEQ